MRKIWTMVAAGVLGVTAPGARAETLTDALISAYRNSHLLEQNQAVLRAADEDLATAVGTLLPVVSLQATTSTTAQTITQSNIFTGSTKIFPGQYINQTADSLQLVASMNIIDFGRGKANTALKNELVQASQQSLVNVEQQVLLAAVQAYVNLGLQAELVAAQESNVRLITQDLRAAKDRFDVGEVTKTDVALAEAQLASANASLASAQGQYNIARESYLAAIGHYPDKLAGLPPLPATAKNLAAAREIALKTHPVVLQAQHQAKASDLGVDLARAQMRPMISANATMRTADTNSNTPIGTGQLSLTLNQTIYSGGQLSSGIRKSIALQQQAHAALLQTGVTVSQSVGNAWSNILVANASIQAGDQQIRASQAAYDGVVQEAQLGSRTTLDVLNAEQTLLQAKAARLQAAANLYNSDYQLLSAMGLLTVSHLHLGIPTFDPSAYLNAVKHAPATTARGARLDRILKQMGN